MIVGRLQGGAPISWLRKNNREGPILIAVTEVARRCKPAGVTIARCES